MLNTTDKIIKHKVGLLNLADELGNVSKACQVMGMSRDTFYRYKSAVDDGGVEALFERTRRKPNLANRVDEATEQAVIKSATDFPAYGQARTSNELRKLGVFVSPSGVRSIWLRHDLANFKTRLKALEAKVAEEGGILTEAPGSMKPVARLRPRTLAIWALRTRSMLALSCRAYQQTYVDTYCKVAHAKLYTTKTPICSTSGAAFPDLPVLRILTDRGTEYCGRVDKHDYQLFLAINDIDHTKTKVKSPQTNGICERFHKTILQEFYQITFRKKLYETVECRPIWINGSTSTTPNELIRAKCVAVAPQLSDRGQEDLEGKVRELNVT